MFTGLISHVGDVLSVSATSAGRELTVSAPWDDLVDGESIALDGVCLTVTSRAAGRFSVAAVDTTLQKTTIGNWQPGRRVNLERALRAGDRLGGHIVQGHVDGVGVVTRAHMQHDAWLLDVALWEGAEGLCVPQGSMTIDGVSLTVYALHGPREIGVSIVEYTRTHTSLGTRRVGDRVNVELDVIGKYVKQLAAPWSAAHAGISS